MARDKFMFYRSFYEAVRELSLEDRAKVYDAICDFSLNGTSPELTGIPKALMITICPILEANNKRFNNGSVPKRKQTTSKPEAKDKQDRSKPEGSPIVTAIDTSNDIVIAYVKTLTEVSKLKVQLSEEQSKRLVAEYGIEKVKAVLQNMDNYKPLTKKYISVYSTASNWLKSRKNGSSADPGASPVKKLSQEEINDLKL